MHPAFALSPSERRARRIELLVFLLFIIPPIMLPWFVQSEHTPNLGLLVGATIIGDMALLALVVYLNWRSGEPMARIGWTFTGAGRELWIGLALFLPFVMVAAGLESLLRLADLTVKQPAVPIPAISGAGQIALAGVLLTTVAIVEETVFRGYLLLRLSEWRDGVTFPVVVSSLIFALGHQYQGLAGMIIIGTMGAMWAGLYLWRGSLVAPMVIHFLQNALAIAAIGHG